MYNLLFSPFVISETKMNALWDKKEEFMQKKDIFFQKASFFPILRMGLILAKISYENLDLEFSINIVKLIF